MRVGVLLHLKLHFKILSSNSTHWHRMFQYSHSFLYSSSDTACILPMLFFLASYTYINIVYLLDPQLPACTSIKLDPLTNLPDAWASCVALAILTVSHSQRCNEMWRQDSVSLRTENCFSMFRCIPYVFSSDLQFFKYAPIFHSIFILIFPEIVFY
jgi:hypothetical protein